MKGWLHQYGCVSMAASAYVLPRNINPKPFDVRAVCMEGTFQLDLTVSRVQPVHGNSLHRGDCVHKQVLRQLTCTERLAVASAYALPRRVEAFAVDVWWTKTVIGKWVGLAAVKLAMAWKQSDRR